eukprot:CAMPEP_0197394564 /NCGR_PEP_ID=MMETSP1165-20131217/5504_1 /TAXON_ID=284809 /ORGANISM="Chrysocystis fragilis, Strain CCMP3189" /LENGTH=30 /DNA_ID= /DNA_START= /DNA_END= /DNA_ORIENTATION=
MPQQRSRFSPRREPPPWMAHRGPGRRDDPE